MIAGFTRGSPPYGMSAGEREYNRTCQREHPATWTVDIYHANYSAYSGGQRTPSDYSQVRCGTCGRVWRTRAAYVEDLPRTGTH